jgi:hypothetical protein
MYRTFLIRGYLNNLRGNSREKAESFGGSAQLQMITRKVFRGTERF